TGDRGALAGFPVLHAAVWVGHRVRGGVHERDRYRVAADAEVLDRELAEPGRDGLPGVQVGAALPGRCDGRVERVDERVHVRRAQVVLLVPGGGREDDIGVDRRAGLPEVQAEQEVELALGR